MKLTAVRWLARTGLLLATAVALQSLRLIIPIPPLFSTFVIGSLVNACLLIAILQVDTRAGVLVATITPVVAYLQQMLPLPLFIFPVAIGNLAYIMIFAATTRYRCPIALGAAALAKCFVLYSSFTYLLTWVAIAPKAAAGILFVMSWPQLITAIMGGLLAIAINRRLSPSC